MALVKFYKVSVLPTVLEPDAFYYVLNNDLAESYLTDTNAVAKKIGNTDMINQLIDAKLEDFTYVWNSPSALSTWLIPHNLNRYPSVTVVDSTGNLVLTDVQYLDANTLSISFSLPVQGSAYLN